MNHSPSIPQGRVHGKPKNPASNKKARFICMNKINYVLPQKLSHLSDVFSADV